MFKYSKDQLLLTNFIMTKNATNIKAMRKTQQLGVEGLQIELHNFSCTPHRRNILLREGKGHYFLTQRSYWCSCSSIGRGRMTGPLLVTRQTVR
jgi:hypothetical protein